jgi:hypothetical protein
MTKETTSIALKFFAIYFLAHTLINVPSSVLVLTLQIQNEVNAGLHIWSVFFSVLAFAVSIVAFLILWKTATSLTKAADDSEPKAEIVETERIMKFSISCIGLVFAIRGLLEMPGFIFGPFGLASKADYSLSRQDVIFIIGSLKPVLAVVIGFWLIAKPKQWLKTIRSIGEK